MDDNTQLAAPAPDPVVTAPQEPAPGPTSFPGVPAPEGYNGPWPIAGMDFGDPSSWLASYEALQSGQPQQ